MAANNQSTFLSAGVFTREFDLSYLPEQISAVGAAVIGPTARGPAMVPTPISTYSEYLRWFGDVFSSGSGQYEAEYKYLTSYTVEGYLKYAPVCTVVRILAGTYAPAYSYVIASSSFNEVAASGSYASTDMAFKLTALTDGNITNSGTQAAAISGSGVAGDLGTDGLLLSGSAYNIRWEVANVSPTRGTFDLYIRRGDDTNSRKVVLEQYSQLSLDPQTSNYITKVIGDMRWTLRYDSSGAPYLQKSGSYQNRSRFVLADVIKPTLRYLDSNGSVRSSALTGSLPMPVSGTFAFGSEGNVSHPKAMYGDIWNLNTQGFNLASSSYGQQAYYDAIDILANKDQYDINLLFTPGIIDGLTDHARVATRAINMCEDRGDVMYVLDPTYFGSTVGQAQAAAEARNTNYAAMYYPWCQIPDADLGKNVWVPPSAVAAAVYSFNDQVAHPWYAPAGLNRGQLDNVIQTERLMTHNDRDNLYVRNVNPIASFPKTGMAIWGQKTLQKKKSALDRINVRRLLIDAKRFVAETCKYLVFEQNTVETRTKFIELTDPYFRKVKALQGLYDYRIIIDERNNTPDVIDRNEMRAQIYVKPAKTAEFIIVDFVVLPTGALFPVDAK
jgi:hypothetical protein